MSSIDMLLKEYLKPVQADLGTLKTSAEPVTRKLDVISTLRTAVEQLKNQQKLVHAKVDSNEEKCKTLEEKVIQWEAYSMRNNLKLAYRQENYEDCENFSLICVLNMDYTLTHGTLKKFIGWFPEGKVNVP